MRALLFAVAALVSSSTLAAEPFAHAPHAGTPCADCHTRGTDQALVAPAPAGCAQAACHGEGYVPAPVAPFEPRLKVPFPHEVPAHGDDCTGCHTKTLDAGAARPWLADTCFKCHLTEGDGVTRCAPCHAPEGPARVTRDLLGPPRERPTVRDVFEHAPHTGAGGLDCLACHGDTRHDARPVGTPLMRRTQCLDCHEERNAGAGPRDCVACHREDLRRVKPVDHGGEWRLRHPGEGERRALADHGQDCATCHGPDACRDCHRTVQPRSHTALWRDRTHGRAAEWDRETCRTCHETGTCIACHSSTQPINHRGAWRSAHGLVAGSQADPRCTTCHQPSWCTACHRGER